MIATCHLDYVPIYQWSPRWQSIYGNLKDFKFNLCTEVCYLFVSANKISKKCSWITVNCVFNATLRWVRNPHLASVLNSNLYFKTRIVVFSTKGLWSSWSLRLPLVKTVWRAIVLKVALNSNQSILHFNLIISMEASSYKLYQNIVIIFFFILIIFSYISDVSCNNKISITVQKRTNEKAGRSTIRCN